MESNYQVLELATLRPNTVKMLLTQMFPETGLTDPTGQALVRNFVRLVDLAIREYELGRESILRYDKDMQLAYYIRASGFFEECIGSTQRASCHLRAIRRYKDIPLTVKKLCPQKTLVLSGPVEKKLTGMRDAITHLEERILGASTKGPKIVRGEPIALSPEKTKLMLGSYEIPYSDLAAWLTELHSIATDFVQYRGEGTQGYFVRVYEVV